MAASFEEPPVAATSSRPTSIDISREQLITLAEAAKFCPRRRLGRKVSTTTLYRWIQHGCRGTRLEATMTPSGYATSREALQRFFDRLSRIADIAPSAANLATDADVERIDKELRERYGL